MQCPHHFDAELEAAQEQYGTSMEPVWNQYGNPVRRPSMETQYGTTMRAQCDIRTDWVEPPSRWSLWSISTLSACRELPREQFELPQV